MSSWNLSESQFIGYMSLMRQNICHANMVPVEFQLCWNFIVEETVLLWQQNDIFERLLLGEEASLKISLYSRGPRDSCTKTFSEYLSLKSRNTEKNFCLFFTKM